MELESTVEEDKIDIGLARLRLQRRCTKRAIPIRAQMATTPPMMPPAIAAVVRFLRDGGRPLVVAPLTFIVCTGTLQEGSSQERKTDKGFACTNSEANGANTAPCAGLISIIATSIGVQIQFPNHLT
jgi:hypothetical protein